MGRRTKIDCKDTIEEYIFKKDWRISANSNATYSNASLINNISGKIIANYWLDNIYSKDAGDAHRNGDFYIHDLDSLTGYCCGHDLQKLLQEGFNGVISRVGAKPPKHFREALYQMANYLGILQAEWAGAQAFSSFDTLLAPYVFYDMNVEGLTERDIKKAIVNFVYNLNVPSRWGQSPFSNLTIDWTVPSSLKDLVPMYNDIPYFIKVFSDNKEIKLVDKVRERLNDYESDEETLMYSLTYKHFQPEMDIINRCFYQVLTEGDKDGQPFTFPIPTVNITEDFDWDNPNCYWLFENAAKYGSSYFQNFIGSQYLRDENGKLTIRDENAYSPEDLRSMCPITLDTLVVTNKGIFKLEELDENTHKVRTNMARWANFKKSPIYDNHQVLRITFENKSFVDMSVEHLQYATKYENGKISSKLYKASELEVGMKCLFMYGYRVNGSRGYASGTNEWAITQIEKIGVTPTQCIEIVTDDESEHEFMLANGLMTHNCRLSLNRRALRKRGGGLFGSDSQTGSLGVVTINMARLGYLYKGNLESLKNRLKELCILAKDSLEIKRKTITKLNDEGLYPYTRRYINTLDTFFSTIGVNGMNEMVRNFTDDEYDITDEYGQEMCKDLLSFIRDLLVEFQEETGNLYNLEATPAEGANRRLSNLDLKTYPDIIHAGPDDAPYYTNSSQLPVDFSSDPFEVLDLQDELQKMYTGGCVEKGNYVLTDRGFILIEDLVNNYTPDDDIKVISYNLETNSAEWDRITAYHKIDVSKKDKIRIKGKSKFDITTSDWHPFFVLNKEGIVEERRADELKYGDYLICNKTCMFDTNSRELTRDLAYLIGYFIGDGSMSRIYDNRGGNNIPKAFVRFSDSNIQNLERITRILKENNFANVSITHIDKRSELLREVSTTAKAVSTFLESYGFTCGSKTYTVHFSEQLKSQLNKENALALLSGLIDSDGHIDKHDDLEYSTASAQLAEDILWLCSMLGIKCNKIIKLDKRWKNSINYRIQISHRELYRFENELMSNKKCSGIYKNKRHKCKHTEHYNTIFVTSVSKTEVEDNEFYDLTTEKNHNYLCGKNNLVFIHNTTLHLYMNERISTPEACKQLVKKVLSNYRLPYISITPSFSVCPKHGYIAGHHEYCPKCDAEIMEKYAEEVDFNK